MQKVAEGDEVAFRELFDLYRDRFYATAFKMSRSEYIAEETVQDVFVTIWQKRHLLHDLRNGRSYIYTIFYHIIYGHFRKEAQLRKACNEMLPSIEPCDESGEMIDEKYLTEERLALLEMALEKLPPQQAAVYRLSKIEGLSREQVATQMGISPNTVRNHLVEAMRSLKRVIKIQVTFIVLFLQSL